MKVLQQYAASSQMSDGEPDRPKSKTKRRKSAKNAEAGQGRPNSRTKRKKELPASPPRNQQPSRNASVRHSKNQSQDNNFGTNLKSSTVQQSGVLNAVQSSQMKQMKNPYLG